MDVIEAIHRRRSVRDYTGDRVDEAVVRRILDAATWAPSAINQQPWLFTVVREQATLNHISSQAKEHLLSTPGNSMPRHLRDMLSNPDFQIFYHAPMLIVISGRTAGPWIVEDCALAAENLMLAAYAAGLGSCWIGFAQGWLQTQAGKKALNLSPESLPVAPIVVGRARSVAPVVPRTAADIRWLG
jgi:nitroreductase